MYTTDHLIEDCVGSFIENQPYSINRSSLLNDRQYCEIWFCLLQWTEKQIKRKNSFIIPHFGLIKHNNDNVSENPNNHGNQRWKLYIESRYVTEQNSKLAQNTNIKSITKDELYNSAAIKCHISSLSQYSSSLSESQLMVGLKHILSKLFQQICRSALSTKNYCDIDYNFESHLKILINFGWGYLSCCDGIIDFIFTLNESLIINPNIPKGLKYIPKKYLQSTASLLSCSSIPSNVKITNTLNNSIHNSIYNEINEYKLPVDSDYNNPLIHLSSRESSTESPHKKLEYPSVLSQFSLTLGSTYSNHTYYETPSKKIGLFYTPTASLYRINTTSKTIEYTHYLPFFQSNPEKYYAKNAKKVLLYELKHKNDKSDISCLEIDIAKSCQRYDEYLQNQMNECDIFIPPLKDEIIVKILNKLEPDLTILSQEKVEQILKENLNNIQSENIKAIKQSILDYVLRNNTERMRLNIAIPPHHIKEWGNSPLPYSAPLSWNNRLQKAWKSMNNSSYFVNSSIIEMLCLWENYKHYRLFYVNSNININSSINIYEFHKQQNKHLEFVRNIFTNNWYNESVNIMKRYVEENGLDSSEKSTISLFSSIAAFMSCKLCEIVYESLKDCINFFEQYKNAQIVVYDENILNIENTKSKYQCLWKISLEFVGKDDIQYEIPLEEINLTINQMIENIITCFNGIACVEGKIFGLLENVTNLNIFIDDQIKKETRYKILNITHVFIEELNHLKHLYWNQFAPLFSVNNEFTTKLIKNHNLSQLKNEIAKYEQIRQNVINKGKLRFKMGLFCVECHTINSLIVNHAQDLKNGITNHVAKKLIHKAQQLIVDYENKSKTLLNTPHNATQIINLSKYVKIFNQSQLSKCQNIYHQIGKQLTFLFETDHPLTHDLLRNVARVSDWNKKIIKHKYIAEKNLITQKECIKIIINDKSKQFEIKIKKLYQEVQGLQLLSHVKHNAKVNKVKENMKIIIQEKEYIEKEQILLQIQISHFKIYKMLHDAVEKL